MTNTTLPSHCTKCGASLSAQDRFCTKCGAPVQQDVRANRTSLPIWIWLAGAIALAALAFFLLNSARPITTPASGVADEHDAQGIPYPEVPRLSVVEAKASWDAKNAVFVDVRGESDYAAGHIANAVSLPLIQIGEGATTLPLQAEILTYCT